jgi:GR25 family glycosyltransferase involved in LPS biosynthesis
MFTSTIHEPFNPFSFLDKIYVIHLDKNQTRKKKISQQLNRFTNNYSFFKAIDGSTLTPPDYYPHISSILLDNYQPKQVGVDLTPGAIGCAMSHKKIWEQTLSSSRIQNVLILEDDAILTEHFQYLDKMLSYVPKDWDIIYLGSSQYQIKKKINPYVSKLKYAYTTIGYIINPRSAQRLLSIFPLQYQLDTAIHLIKTHKYNPKSLHCYILEPNPVKNGFMKSDIQIK